jgi:hypothetical protein
VKPLVPDRDRTAKNVRLFVAFLRRLVKPIDKEGGSIREPNTPLRCVSLSAFVS